MGPNLVCRCPYKRKKFGYRLTWEEDHVKIQGEDGLPQAKERVLRKNKKKTEKNNTNKSDPLISDS